jgi:cytochrome c peroxidase
VTRLRFVSVTALALAVVVGACAGTHKSAKTGFDPHGDPGISTSKLAQILNAAQAITASTSRAALVAEGQKLFESTSRGRQGEACATCHVNGGGVNMAVGIINHPQKPGDFTGPRTPIPLWGVANTAPYTWGGTVPTLETQVTNTILNFFVNGKTQPAATTAKQMAAIVAYLKTLKPPTTAFDNGTMSAEALQGQALFNGKATCVHCHSGPFFTDNRIHVIDVPPLPGETDPGNPSLPGGFNTASLRDVRNSAPYMHNGSLPTLSAVIDFYDNNKVAGVPPLSGPDKAALVAYLASL